MTDTNPATLQLPKRGPRTQPPPELEALRHASEVTFWAAHLEEFYKRIPKMRRDRGDERAGLLVGDVLKELTATHGEDIARGARERLMARWREQASVGVGP